MGQQNRCDKCGKPTANVGFCNRCLKRRPETKAEKAQRAAATEKLMKALFGDNHDT